MTFSGTALALTIASVLLVPQETLAQDSYSLSGQRVAIYNLVGEVEIVAGTGSEVSVEVITGGEDRGELRFETGEKCGANTLRIVYPDDDIVYPTIRGRTQVHVRDDGTFYGHHNWHRGFDWGCETQRRRQNEEVEISNRGRGAEAFADLRIEVPEGKTLEVYLAAGRITADNISGRLIIDAGAVTVEASNVEGEFLVDTGSGSINLDGGRGDIFLDTGSGEIEVRNIEGDVVILDTGSGQVTGSSITTSNLSVDTGSGSVDLTAVTSSDINIDTGSGSVDLTLLSAFDDLVIDTGSGSVDLRLAVEPDARIEVDTGSGGIDIDFPISVRRWERTNVTGTAGNGSGRLLIDTGSGGVSISRR